MLLSIWQRFLWLGWIGKTIVIIVVLSGISWIFGRLGGHDIARSFGSVALYILGALLALLFIRLIWRDATSHHRK